MLNMDGSRPRTAFNSGAMLSDLLSLEQTDTATMLDFCTLLLTTWMVASSVLGICPPDGSASRTGWRWSVKIIVGRERQPSWWKSGDVGSSLEVGGYEGAAAA